jgi:signal transduction histidine kinase
VAAVAWWVAMVAMVGFTAVRLWYRLEVRADSPLIVVVTTAGFVIVVVSGLVACAGRPDTRIGLLLVAWGMINLTGGIGDYEHGLPLLWSYLTTPLVGAVVAHALLTYPGGRTATRMQRLFLVMAYAAISLWIINVLISEPSWISHCPSQTCPPNPLLIRPVITASWVLWWSQRVAMVGLGLWFAVLLVSRIRRIGAAERRSLLPVAVAAALAFSAFLLRPILDASMVGPGWWWWVPWWLDRIGMVAVPVAMAAGLLATRTAPSLEDSAADVQATLAEVNRSRARLVTAADEERRRLERDLHDSAQQSLLGVGMSLQAARRDVPDNGQAAQLLDEATAQLLDSLAELRGLARGLKPALLVERGLAAALAELARQAPVPVDLDVAPMSRPAAEVELTAYYVVAEALQDVATHEGATRASVVIRSEGRRLRLVVADDGARGGEAGTGPRPFEDRVAAMNGNIRVDTRAGGGTRIEVELPFAVDLTGQPGDAV